MRKIIRSHGYLTAILILLSLLLLGASPLPALAAESFNHQLLRTGETINGPGFFAGSLLQIDGTVNGTTFASGQEVRVNGVINGDLFAAAQIITLNGKVNGNIYVAGQQIMIGGQSSGDVFAAGQGVDILPAAVLGRDLFAAGSRIQLDGTVPRHFNGGGMDIVIGGSIGQDADLEADSIILLDGARIDGQLTYRSANQATLAAGAQLSRQPEWQKTQPPRDKRPSIAGSIAAMLFSIASTLVIWFLVTLWRPDFWGRQARSISSQPLKTLGTGVLAFLLTPLLLILVMLTIIGIPAGILMATGYGAAIYLSKIVAAVYLAAWLSRRFHWSDRYKGFWPLLLVLIILAALAEIPIVGFIVWLLVVFAGLGAFIQANYRPKLPPSPAPAAESVSPPAE